MLVDVVNEALENADDVVLFALPLLSSDIGAVDVTQDHPLLLLVG